MNVTSIIIATALSLAAVQSVNAQEASLPKSETASQVTSKRAIVTREEVCIAAQIALAAGHIQYGEATQFYLPSVSKDLTRAEVARQTRESIRLGFRNSGEA